MTKIDILSRSGIKWMSDRCGAHHCRPRRGFRIGRAVSASSSFLRRSAMDAGQDPFMRFGRTAPANDLDPFARLEVLVVGEEMLDLLQRYLRQIDVARDAGVALGELGGRYGDDLFIATRLVLHHEHANDLA